MTDHDDELLARLRAADPAAALPPTDPASVDRLLEDTMSNDLQHESRETGARDRSPMTWLVAAAAVAIIAGVGFFAAAQLSGDDPTPPSATDGSGAGSTDLTVTELAAPGQAAYAARCMVPDAQMLATQTIAFDGVVDDITDGLVTLTPSRFYAGAETEQVQVRAPAAELQALIGAVEFKDGERYLVSARNGRVSVCGFTGPYRPELAALYEEAFPG